MRSEVKMTFCLIPLSQVYLYKILILKYISVPPIAIILSRLLLKCTTLCQTSDLKVEEYQISTVSRCTDACSVPLPRDAVVADKGQISRLLHTLFGVEHSSSTLSDTHLHDSHRRLDKEVRIYLPDSVLCSC